MALPPGFQLEESVQPISQGGVSLPAGFQIETVAPTVTPKPELSKPSIFTQAAGGLTEPLAKMATGVVAKPVSEVAGIAAMFADYLGGMNGDPMGFKKQVQESLTYQPRTAAGQSEYNPLNAIPEAIGKGVSAVTSPVMETLRGNAAANTPRGMVVNALGEAVPQSLGFIGVKNAPALTRATSEGLAQRAIAKAQEASTTDWQNAARIEAAKAASDLPHPISLNPAMSNPTLKNKALVIAADPSKLNTALSKKNMNAWANNVKADMGLHVDVPLTSDAPFKAAITRDAAPYREVKKMGPLNADEAVVNKLNSALPPDLAVNQGAAPQVKTVIDNLTNKIESGLTGAQALDEIRALRASAKSKYDADKLGKPDPVSSAVADSHVKLADALEDLIEKNVEVSNPKILPELRNARKKMATTYLYQNATDFNTGLVDPNKIARQTATQTHITGVAKDLGRIAGNFPEVADMSMSVKEPIITKYSRAGVGGGLGLAAGSLMGTPIAPAMAIGAGITTAGGILTRKKLLSEAFQKEQVVPKDRRIHPTEPVVETPVQEPTRLLGSEGYVPPTPFREVPQPQTPAPNFTMYEGATPSPYLKSLPYDESAGKLPKQDITNVVRVPNDKVMAEYLRAKEVARIADEKEAALAKLSDRNASMAAAREAKIAREKLMDIVEQLQERLGNPRPVSNGIQGKKTRAFQRGMMTGENK